MAAICSHKVLLEHSHAHEFVPKQTHVWEHEFFFLIVFNSAFKTPFPSLKITGIHQVHIA